MSTLFKELGHLRILFFAQRSPQSFFLFLLSMMLNGCAALLEGVSFWFILMAFQSLTKGTTSSFLSSYFDKIPLEKGFLFFALFSIGAQVVRSIFSYAGTITSSFYSMRIQLSLQRKVYEQILQFSFPFVSRYKVGDLISYASVPSATVPKDGSGKSSKY